MNFRDFVEQTIDAVESVAFTLDGDRDITPMLHLETPDGVSVHGLDPQFFASPAMVQILVSRYVLALIAGSGARKVGWTFCAWAAPVGAERPAEHPDRRELLTATFIDREVVEHWAAPIIRTGGQVIIGARASAVPNVMRGNPITAIQEALR